MITKEMLERELATLQETRRVMLVKTHQIEGAIAANQKLLGQLLKSQDEAKASSPASGNSEDLQEGIETASL